MFKNNFKETRKKNTVYTQADMAIFLKCSLDTYASYEKGRRKPKDSRLKEIKELLNDT